MATTFKQPQNNVRGVLASGIDDNDLSITLSAGHNVSNELQWLTLVDQNDPSVYEIVLASAVATNTVTLTNRAQQSTTARAWTAGDYVYNFITAGALDAIHTAINAVEAQTQKLDSSGNVNAAITIGGAVTGPSGAAFTIQAGSSQELYLRGPSGTNVFRVGASNIITCYSALIPSPSGTRDLGSAANLWRALYLSGDAQIDGGDITTAATTFNLLNATATTVNAFGAATAIAIGAATGTTTVNNSLKAKDFRLAALNTAPANASDTGTAGEVRIDASAVYVCTAANTWKKVAIATW